MKQQNNTSAWNAMRDAIQHGVYVIISHPVDWMVRIGITPNVITLLSLMGNAVAAATIICGESLTAAGIVLLLSSSLDMVDGFMARKYGMESTFGAFLDSVVDRYSELITLAAIAIWIDDAIGLWASLVTYAAVIGSVMVSYARARAEGLNVECKVGLMQRPERVVLTAVALIAAGTTDESLILAVAMAVIALLSNLTAIWRVLHVYRLLNPPAEN